MWVTLTQCPRSQTDINEFGFQVITGEVLELEISDCKAGQIHHFLHEACFGPYKKIWGRSYLEF